jgi:selenocysteine lyase/cysteine desulfurase
VAALRARLEGTAGQALLPAAGPVLGDRSWFPELRGVAYLNHAAVSPPSRLVQAAVAAMLGDYASQGVGAVAAAVAQRERLRARLATLVGAAPGDIGLVPNTTHGVLAVALGLPWRAGDRILCFDGEFPTNVLPWRQAAEAHGLELSFEGLQGFGDAPGQALERVEAQLRRGLRLVAVSAVQFRDGTAMPLSALAALCHAHGAELFVDAIQAAGLLPLDLRGWGIDYLSCGSHKWLMGTEGCGFVAIHPDRVGALRPAVAGWLSVEDPLDFLFSGRRTMRYDKPVRRGADRVEVGAPNALGFVALEAGLAPLIDLGPARILAHVQAVHDALEGPLLARGFRSLRPAAREARSGILSFLPPPEVDLARLVALLGERGVSVSQPDGRLRLSPHWPSGLDQVAPTLAAFDHALPRARA